MANLIVVCGPQAVGKMTVAESLRDKLKYNLMVNHDSIEVSDRIFGFNTPAQRAFNAAFREKAFELAEEYGVDLIFTCVVAFELDREIEQLKKMEEQFTRTGGSFYLVELSADLNTRLERNLTPHRMERKASKRNTEWSQSDLLRSMEKHRLNTPDGVFLCAHHLKIDNTALSPDEAADRVIACFGLTPDSKAESEYRFGV